MTMLKYKQSSKGVVKMNRIEAWLTMLEYSLNTNRKKHIAGGILMSISVLFGGLAFTVISLKTQEEEDE